MANLCFLVSYLFPDDDTLSVLSLPRTRIVKRPKKKEEYDEDDPQAYKGLPVPDKV